MGVAGKGMCSMTSPLAGVCCMTRIIVWRTKDSESEAGTCALVAGITLTSRELSMKGNGAAECDGDGAFSITGRAMLCTTASG